MRAFVLLVLGLSAWCGAWLLEPRIPLRIKFSNGQISALIAGESLETLTVPAFPPFESFTVAVGASPQDSFLLNTNFITATGVMAVTDLPAPLLPWWSPNRGSSDWWLDRHRRHGVYSTPIPFAAAAADWSVETDFVGRTDDLFLKFEGEHPVEIELRFGLVSNDLSLRSEGGGERSTLLVRSVAQGIAGSSAALLWGAGWAFFLAAPLLAFYRRALDAAWPAMLTPTNLTGTSSQESELSPTAPHRGALKWVAAEMVGWGICGGVVCAIVSTVILEGIPHFQDDFGYLLRASWLVEGMTSVPAPFFADLLAIPHTFIRDGRWLSAYPVGWPLLLGLGSAVLSTIGESMGVPDVLGPHLVAPLCSAVTVATLWWLTRRAVGVGAARFATVFLLTSPQFLLLGSSLMSHAAAAMLTVLGLACIVGERYLLAGIIAGFGVAVRPLTGATFVALWLVLLLVKTYRSTIHPLTFHRDTAPAERQALIAAQIPTAMHLFRSSALLFAGGVLLGSLPLFIDNYLCSGHPLTFAYTKGLGHRLTLPELGKTLEHLDVTLPYVAPLLLGWFRGLCAGWPAYSWLFAPVFLAIFFPHRSNYLRLFGVIFLTLPLVYIVHDGRGLHAFGPRFYYEGFIFYFPIMGAFFAFLVSDNFKRFTSWPPRLLGLILFIGWGWHVSSLPALLVAHIGYNAVEGSVAASWRNIIHHQPAPEGPIAVYVANWQDYVALSEWAARVPPSGATENANPPLILYIPTDHRAIAYQCRDSVVQEDWSDKWEDLKCISPIWMAKNSFRLRSRLGIKSFFLLRDGRFTALPRSVVNKPPSLQRRAGSVTVKE